MRAALAATLSAALLAAGCERRPHVVSASDLTHARVSDTKTVEVIEPGGERHKMAVHEVVERCRDRDCSATYVDLGDSTHVKTGELSAVTLSVAGLGLLLCTAACDSPYNYISGGTLAAGAAVAVGGVIYVLYLLSTVRH